MTHQEFSSRGGKARAESLTAAQRLAQSRKATKALKLARRMAQTALNKLGEPVIAPRFRTMKHKGAQPGAFGGKNEASRA